MALLTETYQHPTALLLYRLSVICYDQVFFSYITIHRSEKHAKGQSNKVMDLHVTWLNSTQAYSGYRLDYIAQCPDEAQLFSCG